MCIVQLVIQQTYKGTKNNYLVYTFIKTIQTQNLWVIENSY